MEIFVKNLEKGRITMFEPKKILILTCSHGSGHKMVAQTLKESFEARGHLVSVEDLFDKTNPTLNRMIEKSYLLSYSIGSSFYERVYYDVEEYAHNKLCITSGISPVKPC